MVLKIHSPTPEYKIPKCLKWMFVGLFVLMYGVFAALSICLICYAESILWGIVIALFPFGFLFWFFWDQRNLERAYVEVFEHNVLVAEYPVGIRLEKQIDFSQIDCAKLVRPYSWKLRGARI